MEARTRGKNHGSSKKKWTEEFEHTVALQQFFLLQCHGAVPEKNEKKMTKKKKYYPSITNKLTLSINNSRL
jgi:hypothetical protein